MKKFSLLILTFFVSGVFLIACSPQTQKSNGTQQTATTQANSSKGQPDPDGKPSIVRGVATLGPTCPVEKVPPDPNCAPKPYMGSFTISGVDGVQVKTFETMLDGSFEVTLPQGYYVVNLANDKVYPRMNPKKVTVLGGKITSIQLELDSGIR